ncbi:hypothetical protein [Allokutzneria sp. NRRL B-24872]|uniref:hypothetical protein n=1 Tax=Allokutzneria sp. NRRL B-24872 TaxID=1137961 RepID=UPI000A3C8E7C|nr:hypothetical protein [Allokutzneria sp. NRRL B-24872]
MTDKTPTLVTLYAYASGEPKRAAEFRWSETDGVTVTVVDPEWGVVGKQFYDEGVLWREQARRVRPSEGPDFMHALLSRTSMSYFGMVDESDGPAV